MTQANLAYIGLGLMGLPMTLRLLAAGRTVHVWNRSAEKLKPAIAAGATAAATPRQAAAAADIVLMCLFDAKAVETVVFGADGKVLQQIGGPTYLSQIGYVAAAVGVVISVTFLGETYPLAVWLGAGVIAMGIALSTYAQFRR